MTQRFGDRMRAACLAVSLLAGASILPAGAETSSEKAPSPSSAAPDAIAHRAVLQFGGLEELVIHIVRPANFDPDGHRVLLYFVGGGQEERDVEAIMNSLVAQEAVRRGYIFVSPVAPCYSCTFVAKGEDYFPTLFERLAELLPMSQERFHLMGFSNGGRSSLYIGTRRPEWVASITTYPGYLRNGKYDLLDRLSDTCVVMYVGRRDTAFLAGHKRVVTRLENNGHPVRHRIYNGRSHSIRNLWTQAGAELLMDGIDEGLGCPGGETD